MIQGYMGIYKGYSSTVPPWATDWREHFKFIQFGLVLNVGWEQRQRVHHMVDNFRSFDSVLCGITYKGLVLYQIQGFHIGGHYTILGTRIPHRGSLSGSRGVLAGRRGARAWCRPWGVVLATGQSSSSLHKLRPLINSLLPIFLFCFHTNALCRSR